ncbi:MAG: indolepyruvate oxidoreductase subunit beta [Parcubacteria group bacterium]|nr:indolepyruvate oxidoreductase subunit beta [Parcubacteria group bacterium]
MENKLYNIVIPAVGGQGGITLARIIAEAAMLSGLDVKMSELHGLAQRGGATQSHVKFGKDVHSSLVPQAGADLILSTEPIEALRTLIYASDNTQVVINSTRIVPISVNFDKKPYPKQEEIKSNVEKFTKKIDFVEGDSIVKKAVGNNVPLNIFLLGYTFHKGYIPLEEDKLLRGIGNIINKKYFEMNKKVFGLAKNIK